MHKDGQTCTYTLMRKRIDDIACYLNCSNETLRTTKKKFIQSGFYNNARLYSTTVFKGASAQKPIPNQLHGH